MTKLVFTNTNCSINKGSAAQVISACEALRSCVPNLEITLITPYPERDFNLCSFYNIHVVSSNFFSLPNNRILRGIYTNTLHIPIELFISALFVIGLPPSIINVPKIQEYASSDAIIDLSGDSYSDGKGGFSLRIDSSLFLGLSMKKPIVMYSQSIGPFRKSLIFFARYCLNRVDSIIVREEISKNYLEETIQLNSQPIHLTEDCAFNLKASTHERTGQILMEENILLKQKPIIGISVNSLLNDSDGRYVKLMAELIDYVIEKYSAQIIFVPHVVSQKKGGKNDDRTLGQAIYNMSKNKNDIYLINGDYSPSELKGIIQLSDIFIGARMHANIAALSSCIPTLAIAWSHKYHGIMQTLGLKRFVCDHDIMTSSELKMKIDDLWLNRVPIKNELSTKVEYQKKLAMQSAEIVRDKLISKKLL